VLSKKPNTAFTQFGRIGGGESLLRHRAHPLSVLLSGKPGAVHTLANERVREGCVGAWHRPVGKARSFLTYWYGVIFVL
ncbi:hypothetical protein, partial [Rhodovulum adriaticum]|uniref:hypothetical protein n=1 Tax=Rhodovulum adriaticum TaxID=35804 RepID=UPI001A918DFE